MYYKKKQELAQKSFISFKINFGIKKNPTATGLPS